MTGDMIDIEIPDNTIGWLHLKINDKLFTVSYLTDFITDMRELLTFADNNYRETEVHRIYLDGEGKDLFLTSWRAIYDLYIVWEYYGEEDKQNLEIMKFNYNDFVKEFNEKFEVIKDKYYQQFDLDSISDK